MSDLGAFLAIAAILGLLGLLAWATNRPESPEMAGNGQEPPKDA